MQPTGLTYPVAGGWTTWDLGQQSQSPATNRSSGLERSCWIDDAAEPAAQSLGDSNYIAFLYGLGDDLVFDKDTLGGTTVTLGLPTAGEKLTFRLDVRNTGDSFFTGAGLLNPDLLPHALAITRFDDRLKLLVTTVGFEDLLGGGDKDYNDFVFRLTYVFNLPPGPVSEPTTLALLGLGLAGIPLVRRRRTPT